MVNLYRYISFESFVDIVQSKSLSFASPQHAWEDAYEGLLYRAIRTQEGRRQIYALLSDEQRDIADAVLLNDEAMALVRYQCWSDKKDEVAMWSIYSYGNKSIMISTTAEKIESLECVSDDRRKIPVGLMPMKYVDSLNLKQEVESAFSEGTFSSVAVFSTKRKAFMHEGEHRAYVAGAFGDPREPVKVPLPVVSDFIESVMVHPSAPGWYVDMVERYCEINGLHFLGQSKLYKFEI